jgi:hypothetical protein
MLIFLVILHWPLTLAEAQTEIAVPPPDDWERCLTRRRAVCHRKGPKAARKGMHWKAAGKMLAPCDACAEMESHPPCPASLLLSKEMSLGYG